MEFRVEKDVLGEVKVPKDAYYGSETQRAFENFPVSGHHLQKAIIRNYAILKKAAALANMRAGKLDKKLCPVICDACDEVAAGKFDDQFVVDAFQAGAGTSTNMNVNEVVANRAVELLKGRRGDYKLIHPNDHVNMSQSTNDTFHCVEHMAMYEGIHKELLPALEELKAALGAKSKEFADIVKVGRTHLQDAVPMTLGQEFSGYATAIDTVMHHLSQSSDALLEIPLGGTALGTGINTPKDYSKYAIDELRKSTGFKFTQSGNLFGSMQNQLDELRAAGGLREVAVTLGKIANDMRLLSSGPRTAISEIVLPPVQPGSSIMPGKINPSMAEMLNQVCFHALGNCYAVEAAAAGGQLELNVFMPVIAYNIVFAIGILSNGTRAFTKRCIVGIKPNRVAISKYVTMNISTATALSPHIGYAKAADIARTAYLEDKSVMQVCLEMKVLPKEKLEQILDPSKQI